MVRLPGESYFQGLAMPLTCFNAGQAHYAIAPGRAVLVTGVQVHGTCLGAGTVRTAITLPGLPTDSHSWRQSWQCPGGKTKEN